MATEYGSTTPPLGSWDYVLEASVKPVCYYHIPVLVACYAACNVLLRLTTDWRGLKLEKLAGQLSMYPAFFVLVYTSHMAMLDTNFWTASNDSRFAQSNYHTDLFANFYIATNIVQAIGQIQTERAPLLYQLMAHHVLSIACYTSGFYFDRYRWWTAFAGCCEITNFFLVPVFACKEFFPDWRKETWFLWNSRLLWMTFITHRLVLFPCWLGLWVYDRMQLAENANLHWMEEYFYPGTILGLFILSFVWFLQISRGLKKQMIIYMEAQQEAKQKKQ